MIAAVISFLIFVAYVIMVLGYLTYIPASLSETYYLLPGGVKHLFPAMLWTVSFLLLPKALDVTPPEWQFLIFLALAAIVFVGAAPEFHDPQEGKTHTVAAYAAAILGIAWAVIAADGFFYLVLSFIVACLAANATRTVKSGLTFWLELIAFSTVYISIFNLAQ